MCRDRRCRAARGRRRIDRRRRHAAADAGCSAQRTRNAATCGAGRGPLARAHADLGTVRQRLRGEKSGGYACPLVAGLAMVAMLGPVHLHIVVGCVWSSYGHVSGVRGDSGDSGEAEVVAKKGV